MATPSFAVEPVPRHAASVVVQLASNGSRRPAPCASTLIELPFMNTARLLLVAFASLVVFAAGENKTDIEDEEKAETIAQMHRVWDAIMSFKKDHGQLPDYLSDLVPGYLPNADALVSPTEKRTGRHGDNNYPDPKIRSSFCYEFSAATFGGGGQPFRKVKEAQMEEFGGVVPILRCFLYEGRRLNVAYSGDFYESALYWETAPEAKAVTARIGPGPGFKNGEFTRLTVVDAASGTPLPDAEVRLTNRSYHALPLPERILHTATDGTVQVPLGPAQPPSRRLTITVSKAGYFPPIDNWKEGSLPEEAVMGLEKGTTIGGTVKLNDGTALPGAQVEIRLTPPSDSGRAIMRSLATVVAGADGRWSCAQLPGDFLGLTLRVRHPAAWTTDFTCEDRLAPGQISRASLSKSTADLRLPPAVNLHGTLTAADGTPVAGAELLAVSKPPAPVRGVVPIPAEKIPEPIHAKSDAEGHYNLPWGDSGELAVFIFPPASAPAKIETEAAPLMPAQDMKLKPGRVISGRILGDDGKPLSGARATLCAWGGEDVPGRKTVLESDAEGNFSWAFAPSESVTLQFEHDRFIDRCVTIDADTSAPLAVRLYRRALNPASARP